MTRLGLAVAARLPKTCRVHVEPRGAGRAVLAQPRVELEACEGRRPLVFLAFAGIASEGSVPAANLKVTAVGLSDGARLAGSS